MLFNSLEFALFFPIVVLLYYVVPKKFKQLWLLLASYYFYMNWNPKYALLIGVSTVVTYGCSLLLAHIQETESDLKKQKRKKVLSIAGSLTINLAILLFFKYFYFMHDTVASLLNIFGKNIGPSRLNIVLPVGISFYTFQAIGYTIDVYRGDIKAERNFIRYALFVSFFPQLVAGPIERSRNLLTQIQHIPFRKLWNFDRISRGLLMMLWGYFMKMVIADRAAVLVEKVFGVYFICNGVALLTAIVCFAFQLYCDFASYSTIAIGASKILGIELMENFAQPFFSRNTSELWRRWHISLSSWFREYLYIPLGGSRCSRLRKYCNLMITFLVSGLWHGASWHFVLWGGMQGAFIVLGDFLAPYKRKIVEKWQIRVDTGGVFAAQMLTTFSLFLGSLIVFRSNSIHDAVNYVKRLIFHFDVWSFFDKSIYQFGLDEKEFHLLIVAVIILLIVDIFSYQKKTRFDSLVKSQCLAVQYVIIVFLFLFILIFGVYGEGYEATQFIYFQF